MDTKVLIKIVAINTVTFVTSYAISRKLGSVLQKRFLN